MSRIRLFAVLLGVALFASCQADATKDAIREQLRTYPESRAQDIYKSFCQDNLGPGHLIPNVESARAYLMDELQNYQADIDSGLYRKPELRYVPVGDTGNYIRVDLAVVLDSLISADELLNAFVRSANEGKTLSEEAWKAKWASVKKNLRKDFPNIPDEEEDLAAIDSLMAEGQFILHHSRVFNQAYHPHYRIVARDIFEKELKAYD